MDDRLATLLTMTPQFTDAEKQLISRAFHYSETAHHQQLRNSGDPYFSHVFETAKILTQMHADAVTISAGLLHDVLEDTNIIEADLRNEFKDLPEQADEIISLVQGVTKLGHLKYRGAKRHAESLRKFFIASANDIRVVMIKLADRLHNISTLAHIPAEKQTRIAMETLEIYARLADRLGMDRLKIMLEDYAFPFAHPNEYQKTKQIMDELVPQAQPAITHAHTEVEKVLNDFNIGGMKVDSRIKHAYSTYKKLEKYRWNTDLVYDIVALRVLTNTVADCYQVLGLVHMLWKPIPKRIKDFIALPKPNGYQSLHTSVITEFGIIEIQIRTHQMHHEAEMGVASHFMYKEKEKQGNILSKKLGWLNEFKELQTSIKNSGTFMHQVRSDLFRHRIFAFSPKGDVIDLPEGATPIDFAYAIHSTIGDHMNGAKVNDRLVAMDTKLNTGDVVEILHNEKQKPNRKWLEMCSTTLAKSHIRKYLKDRGEHYPKQ